MRTIKFRAWDGKTLSFPTSDAWFKLKDGVIEVPKGYSLMQSTENHDKNGVEIFEGDLIRSIETDEVYLIEDMLPAHRHDHSTNIGYYSGKKYHHRDNISSRYTGDDWMSWLEMYEVIGNRYQNPELLSHEKPEDTN